MRAVCRHGHEMTPENTRTRPIDGYTTCRLCEAARGRRNREQAAWADAYRHYLTWYEREVALT